jgi:hypothetical protein
MTINIPYLTKVDIPDLNLLKNSNLPILRSRRSPWQRWGWIATGSVALVGLAVGGFLGYRRYMNGTSDEPASRSTSSKATSNKATSNSSTASKNGHAASTTKPNKTWTKAELYEKAQAKGIEGRSSMSKTELINALDS